MTKKTISVPFRASFVDGPDLEVDMTFSYEDEESILFLNVLAETSMTEFTTLLIGAMVADGDELVIREVKDMEARIFTGPQMINDVEKFLKENNKNDG